jgi:hypothetical protein
MYGLQSRPLWQRAGSGPSVLIDFIQAAAIPAGWRFSRASPATYFDGQCVMQTAGTDMPRFDHDPATGAPLGLLVEAQRTKLLRYSTYRSGWTINGTCMRPDGVAAPDDARPLSQRRGELWHSVRECSVNLIPQEASVYRHRTSHDY